MMSWWQLLKRDFSMPESTIMLGLDVKIRSMQVEELFVKWVGLSIIWLKPAVDVIVSSSFPILSLVSKKYHFQHFPLKSPVIIEIVGWRLLMLFRRMSRESQKDQNCSPFWLGDLYKYASKHRSFFTVISVTKHSFRLDISSLRIMGKWSLEHKHTPPLFVLLAWSALITE